MTQISQTSFLFNDRIIANMEVPVDVNSWASNTLRKNTLYVCRFCGEIWARRWSSDPLFSTWDIQTRWCPRCARMDTPQQRTMGLFFNDFELVPELGLLPGIELIDVLPREILALELLRRGDNLLDCYSL